MTRVASSSSVIFRALRRIPNGLPGKRRFARWATRHVSAWPTLVHDASQFAYEVPDTREPVAFDLAVDGIYEPLTMAWMRANLPPGGTFVDVGANVGAFTIPMAKHVGAQGRVVAIEASPRVFPYLERNVRASGLRHIVCHELAAMARTEDAWFYPPPDDHFGMGSLAPQFDAEPVRVHGDRLDAILERVGVARVDVLKIDVEGFEAAVLSGARQLLTGSRPPKVVFEFCDWAESRVDGGRVGDAQRLLLDLGFQLYRLATVERAPRLTAPLESGSDMLVALR